MASGDWLSAEELERMDRNALAMDLGLFDKTLQKAPYTARFIPPERFHTPTPSDQASPPFVNAERENRGRLAWENKHRQALEDQAEYEGIVNWWKSRGQPYILASQLEDWEDFCEWRKDARPQFKHHFPIYVDKLRARREHFGLEGEVHLKRKIRHQSRLQNWIEFQDYHHRIQAYREMESEEAQAKEDRKILLQWIEEQRKRMVAEEAEATRDQMRAGLLRPLQHQSDSTDLSSEDSFDPEAFSEAVGRSLARIARPLDLDALDQRLENASTPRWASPGRFVTPEHLTPESQRTRTASPDNPERRRQWGVALENKARKTLEDSGCPPCCPIDIEYPYRRAPRRYIDIMKWWKTQSEAIFKERNWIHQAHLKDWEKFCRWRNQRRPQRSTRQAFSSFLDEFRERRRQFGLEGEVHLEAEVENQTQLQNWIEYQDFHHRVQARLEQEPYKDWVEQHNAVLPWIEEQRKIMVAQEEEAKSGPTTEHAAWVDYAISRLVREGNTVSLPDDVERTEEQMNELVARLRSSPSLVPEEKSHPPDPDALTTALEIALAQPYTRPASPGAASSGSGETTPDPNSEGALEEHLQYCRENMVHENEARKRMEEIGYPPCCPANFEFPYDDNLGEYEDIIKAWKEVGRDYRVLCVQLTNWSESRRYRKLYRPKHLTRAAFSRYQDELRLRRRKHRLQGDVSLAADVNSQTFLQNWIEYQDHHLRRFEQAERNLEQAKREYGPGTFGYFRNLVETHWVLSQWTEEQRKIMVNEEAETNAAAETRPAPVPTEQTKQSRSQKNSSRKKTAVAKSISLERNPPSRKRRHQPQLEEADADADAPPSKIRRTSKASQAPKAKTSKNTGAPAPRRSTRQPPESSQTAQRATKNTTREPAAASGGSKTTRESARQVQQTGKPARRGRRKAQETAEPAKKTTEFTASNETATTAGRRTRQAPQTTEPGQTAPAKKTNGPAAASSSNAPITAIAATTSGRRPRTRLAQQAPEQAPLPNPPKTKTEKPGLANTTASTRATQSSTNPQHHEQAPEPVAATTTPVRRGRTSKSRSAATGATAAAVEAKSEPAPAAAAAVGQRAPVRKTHPKPEPVQNTTRGARSTKQAQEAAAAAPPPPTTTRRSGRTGARTGRR
ncbi:uncharacterized protein J3D65DRAFT_353036 [Phyllosticta citribraziliensis]|uniref:Uncharacterized protein n=1 Tax=Phyllosticta citribraziliensis TaxID=989973 RepID=A0ABR1LPW0_9PEZI